MMTPNIYSGLSVLNKTFEIIVIKKQQLYFDNES